MRKPFTTQPALFVPCDLYEHAALQALDGVEALIDWSRLERLLSDDSGKQATGRLGYPVLTLFRALLLGQWYRLSDVRLSAQLARDLLFRKFCRLELDQGVPDATTLGRFRIGLGDRLDACLAAVVVMLEERCVIIAEGRVAIVDATAIEAAQSGVTRPDPEGGPRVKLDSKGRVRAVWGYQAFVNADEDGFVRRIAVSPGNQAEVDSLEALVVGDEAALYADSAYIGPRTRALLSRYGMADRVQRRGARGRKLSPQERARNREIGVTRGRVEPIFGHWKHQWGQGRARFMGLVRTRIQIALTAIGWNLWKGARMQQLYG
jgi:transposase, IS5 family